jgi:hypothetical protein
MIASAISKNQSDQARPSTLTWLTGVASDVKCHGELDAAGREGRTWTVFLGHDHRIDERSVSLRRDLH